MSPSRTERVLAPGSANGGETATPLEKHVNEAGLGACALYAAVGRAERCPGDGCPFWEEGGAVIEAGCAIERLAVALSNPQLVRQLLELRTRLEGAACGGVPEAPSLLHVLGRDRDL